MKGREGPPLGYIWRTWGTTLMCDADHVICCEINVSRVGKHWNASKSPGHVGISRGPVRPLPNRSHFVTVSLCDVNHMTPPARWGLVIGNVADLCEFGLEPTTIGRTPNTSILQFGPVRAASRSSIVNRVASKGFRLRRRMIHR